MKKLIIVLFVILGMTVKISAQIKTSKSSNFEKQAFLTNDKSKVYFLHIVEEKVFTSRLRKRTEETNKIIDTVRVYYVSIIARRFINDSLASLLIDKSLILDQNTRMPIDQSVALPDSLVPRWTYLFGEDTYVKRELRIVGDDILFFNVGSKSSPAVNKPFFCSLFCVGVIVLIISLFIILRYKAEKSLVVIMLIAIFLFFLFFSFTLQKYLSISDIFFAPLIIVVPSLFTLFIKTKKEEILEKHILKC
jgi:hypothetical protein